jgi:twitching motility protein PilT
VDINSLFTYAVKNNASDIHIAVGVEPVLRIDGNLIKSEFRKLQPDDTKLLVGQILDQEKLTELEKNGQADAIYAIHDIGRFRVSAFKQKDYYGMVIRIIPFKIPSIDELGLPNIVKDIARKSRGLVLVTGPSGSGKSTTLASIIDLINEEKSCHIITLEDPIEYLHNHKKSIVSQREVGRDTDSFYNGLRAALRQDPDVIMVGEIRDIETIITALMAAETGHLVLSTLHTFGAANTITRIIDMFPTYQQQQVRIQLASVIEAVICQQLLPRSNDKGRVVATEIMIVTSAIRNLIREDKIHQIDTSIETGSVKGMRTMDQSLLELYSKGIISKATLLDNAINMDYVNRIV